MAPSLVTPTRLTETDLRAIVTNGDGKEYGVTLTESLTTCSCKDALYRGGVCKHVVAVALHVLRTPEQKKEAPVVVAPVSHLMWRDGLVVCGEADPDAKHDNVWVWPWTDAMLMWPEACPACGRIYRSGYNRHMALKEAA